MPLNISDEQCLLWIKDPSISPLVNIKTNKRREIFDKNLDNPKEFFNTIKNACFYNSELRKKIVDKIKEYQLDGTLRLYTLNDKISGNSEYMDMPFTIDECKQWLSNHLVNPRTNEKINIDSHIFIELIYTSIQYGLPTPSISDTPPISKFEELAHNRINKIIKDVKKRYELMNQNDAFFLKHNVSSFDRRLKINDIVSPKKPKAKNSFDVSSSSSSYKSLNSAENRQLRDITLMNEDKEKLVAKYQYNKGLAKKGLSNSKKTNVNYPAYIHEEFKKIIINIQNEVINGDIINIILENITEYQDSDEDIIALKFAIQKYIRNIYKNNISTVDVNRILKENNYDTIEGIFKNIIKNIFAQMINPSIEKLPKELEIGYLSVSNKLTYLKSVFYDNMDTISDILIENYDTFSSIINKTLNENIAKLLRTYFTHIIDDTIPSDFVIDINSKYRKRLSNATIASGDYRNTYYEMLRKRSNEPKQIRLPVGRGLLMGKKLESSINLSYPLFISDNTVKDFSYEDCKNWVILPIIDPRTSKNILIDSPIYNNLLVTSYQYDTNLIPRMITTQGYLILEELEIIINEILKKEGKVAQTREQLEEYIINKDIYLKKKEELISSKIGLVWKSVGAKKPIEGIEIVNKKLNEAFLKSTGRGKDVELPFYVSFSEEAFTKFGVTDITKNSYIELSTYYIQSIDNKNKKANNLGLRWKMINNERYKEGIKREGVEIINKKLKNAILKLASKGNVLPAHVSFSKEDLENFGITTMVPNNNYIKFTFYYKPLAKKSMSDFKFKAQKKIIEITKRNVNYTINKKNFYTVADCLRWARQPKKDPKIPNRTFLRDSPEYNVIFEQALIYDHNIIPINISSNGIKFMKSVIKIKKQFLDVADTPKRSTSNGKNIEDINTKMCIAINNIYDDETNDEGKNYKKFKDKMIKKCKKYNKEPFLCIKKIKNLIVNNLKPNINYAKEYKINYYQISALASLLLKFEDIKDKIYKDEFKNLFINDFQKFYIYIYELDDELNEHKKDAIDAGGPKREFFTKLFEELFCDKEHTTRPFISPPDIIDNKYCINPNFAPDENFRKVIQAYKKNHTTTSISNFDTERDYEYIYFVIGRLLCLPVYNDIIGLPQQFSTHILAGLIIPKFIENIDNSIKNIENIENIDNYDKLYFYLRDFNNAIYYINMISNSGINDIEYSGLSFNDLYVVSKSSGSSQNSSGTTINKENCIKFILQQSKHVITKNFLVKEEINSGKSMKKRYESLFNGFSNKISNLLYNNNITIEQLSLLITNEQLTEEILRELVSNLKVYMEIKYTPDLFQGNYTGVRMSAVEQKERGDELKGYISNIITKKREGETDEEHIDFVKNLLRFWTGLTYYDKTKPYKICYKYGVGININYLPHSHTCMYTLDVFGFRVEDSHEEREKFIYDKFKLAVGEQEMELH